MTTTLPKGCVLGSSVRYNSSMDLDEYSAYYWDSKSNSFKWEYTDTPARVDATDDVIERYAEMIRVSTLKNLIDEDKLRSKAVTANKRVRVIRGKKLPLGTEADCVWEGHTQYGYSAILIIDGKKIYTSTFNLEVVNPDSYLTAAHELEKRAEQAKSRAKVEMRMRVDADAQNAHCIDFKSAKHLKLEQQAWGDKNYYEAPFVGTHTFAELSVEVRQYRRNAQLETFNQDAHTLVYSTWFSIGD